jgi:hypothetical protein
MGVPLQRVDLLINGEQAVVADTAIRHAAALNCREVPAHLVMSYPRETVARWGSEGGVAWRRALDLDGMYRLTVRSKESSLD